MPIIPRQLANILIFHLERGKSVLLLGPRQVGKTTLVLSEIAPDIHLSFARIATRQMFEKDLVWAIKKLEADIAQFSYQPTVFIDEVQKIPQCMDSIQDMIDRKLAKFILSGSSARKLKHGKEVNLLPGRVVVLYMHPLGITELPEPKPSLDDLLAYGSLPGIILENDNNLKAIDLNSYVSTYLEDEIRQEALVRNIGSFSRFLELAASESGQTINASKLSQEVGISSTTIREYYQILEDCLIAHRIDPYTKSSTNRRLIKAPKYIFFDLGVRRAAAGEGTKPNREVLGHLLEQQVQLELIQAFSLKSSNYKLRYWRSPDGPEVDIVITGPDVLIPIEVKLTDRPKEKHLRHLKLFMQEYPEAKIAYIVCQVTAPMELCPGIHAIPWHQVATLAQSMEE